jgi:hypothetical protein
LQSAKRALSYAGSLWYSVRNFLILIGEGLCVLKTCQDNRNYRWFFFAMLILDEAILTGTLLSFSDGTSQK